MKIKKLIKKTEQPALNATLRVYLGEHKFFGPGKYELLKHIHTLGSISQAAKAMNMSYKKAWDMVNDLNENCNKPIVMAQTGGIKGGKSQLSAEGLELMKAFEKIQHKFNQFLEKHIDSFLNHK